MTLPYATATSGLKAREEIHKILRRFGCDSVGFQDEYDTNSVLLHFATRGQNVTLRASAQGWASAWLRENPWTSRKRLSRPEYDQKALEQGMVAVNSILRDWVKGQITAIETGILTFEGVFMPWMIAHDGRTVLEHAQQNLLPAPESGNETAP